MKWLDRRISAPGPYLCLCLSEEDYLKAMRKMKVKSVDDWIKTPQADATVHLTSCAGDLAAVVCVRPKEHSTLVQVAGLLIHEAVHIWQEWCDFYGEHAPGKEQEAYAIQGISQTLIEDYQRQTSLLK